MTDIVKQSFTQYAAAVIQSRALVDVRDGLKPSARQIFYCMDKYKYVAAKPFQKTMAAIGDAMKHFYIHGDSSCEGIIMRAGQPFAMRYPLIEVKGNGGTLLSSGNWAAPRYTETRLSKLAAYLFVDIDKKTIDDWRDNYADNEQYPSVLPTKGYYNIVNGSSGIATGMACSVPQYNIKELNNALIHLIDNPDCDFSEIYCAPDFATGAILYNESDVKESMKNGQGFACKLRSVVEFDSKERCFVVTEIPYGVYTNTICGQLEEIVNGEDNPGIERFNDLTGSTPLIKIYLAKRANPDKVLKYLFKNTFLQYHYGINFTMLDNGRFPRVFGWKEMLQSHIDHERTVYLRAFSYDLNKIKKRLHIIEGLLKAISMIDEVVKTIRQAADTKNASIGLQRLLSIDEEQAKAILEIKLARLAHLEVDKLSKEKDSLNVEKERIENILSNEELFKEEIKKGWREVAEKFGDARRTKIINISKEDEEPTEIKSLQISMTNKNNLYLSEASTLYTQKRGGVGNKAKLEAGEYVIHSEQLESNEEVAFFTARGDFYHHPAASLAIGEKIAVEALLGISNERIVAISAFNKRRAGQNIVFFTKNGFVKKSELAEYNLKRSGSLKAINLDANDEIASILFIDTEDVGIMTEQGNFIRITTGDIRPIGRVAKGIRGIKLNEGDAVCCAYPIQKDTQYIVSVTSSGLFKKTPISEFTVQGKNTKGAKIHKLTGKDYMADFVSLGTETEILVASSKSCIKLSINDVPTLSRVAQGAKAIKMSETDKIIGISLY
jgi:DNA gyrase subunit A